MTDERTFGLSRWEKIRIEAARLATEWGNWRPSDPEEGVRHMRALAEPIEAWLLQADADAEARQKRNGEGKLADEVIAGACGNGASTSPALPVGELIRQGEAADIPPDAMQFGWLREHLRKRGFENAPTMSRQDLIRAYYTDVNGGVFPNFPSINEAVVLMPDELAVDWDGHVRRWADGCWVPIDTLPGHRIESGKIKWAPGLWPPPETEQSA